MHRILCGCIALIMMAGCVSPQLKPDAGAVSRVKSVYLIPMESPPLQIDAVYTASGSASLVHFLPRYTIGMARAVGVLSGIAVLLDLSAASYPLSEYPPLVQPAAAWLPTTELARETAQRLAASGRTVAVSAEIQPIPGVLDRGRTVLMENWMAPIRAWYNDELPSRRYTELAAKGIETVAEVGISNYEIFSKKLLLQVHIKLIDTSSGALIGRARASSFTELPSMDELFRNDAKIFREAVLQAGDRLIGTTLDELGLTLK